MFPPTIPDVLNIYKYWSGFLLLDKSTFVSESYISIYIVVFCYITIYMGLVSSYKSRWSGFLLHFNLRAVGLFLASTNLQGSDFVNR